MKKRVYIETSIPSFYYTRRTDAEAVARMTWTQQWWREFADQFQLVSSAAVIAELRRGSDELREKRTALLKDVELLEISDEVTLSTTNWAFPCRC
jgi:predicted nucleic acid-binding protein